MAITQILTIAFTAILLENVVLSQFLGICPFMGVSSKRESAVGMGFAVITVITIASLVSWVIYNFVLAPFDMIYMRTIVFILVIASLVQIIEMFIKKVSPALYKGLGIFLPLITTNCAVLGVAVMAAENSSFGQAFIYAFASGIGFLFVMFIFASLREKMKNAPIPAGFKGVPIALITASIMAMIFARFAGVI